MYQLKLQFVPIVISAIIQLNPAVQCCNLTLNFDKNIIYQKIYATKVLQVANYISFYQESISYTKSVGNITFGQNQSITVNTYSNIAIKEVLESEHETANHLSQKQCVYATLKHCIKAFRFSFANFYLPKALQ